MNIHNKEIQKHTLRFKAISPISLSPREGFSFYKGVEFEEKDLKNFYDTNSDKINIIYPFYQYGEYLNFNPRLAHYYIPGSSLKGALTLNKKINSFFVDDVELEGHAVMVLKQLKKLQYLNHDGKAIELNDFFPNVGIEMLKSGTKFEADVYLSFDKRKMVNDALAKTKKKLEYSIAIFSEIVEKARIKDEDNQGEKNSISENNLKIFKKVIEELVLLRDKAIIFIGGYKGLAHSINSVNQTFEHQSVLTGYPGTFYIDLETNLPFGILEVLI